MIELLANIGSTFLAEVFDVLPIACLLFGFQFLVLKEKPPNIGRIVIGFLYVLGGLTLFIVGLEEALFPLGRTMATQLTAPDFINAVTAVDVDWRDYFWVYAFAAAIGFSTTIAEPTLISVSMKASEISGGALPALGLRVAVAVGVALGVAIGTYRIVTGTSLPLYIGAAYILVIIQTLLSRQAIIPLAYDSGGVTTSTVTVPVVAALGIGLASSIPGRNPLIDGFGLIAFASIFPIMSVLAYEMLTRWFSTGRGRGSSEGDRP